MADRYRNFAELAAAETEGTDYRIHIIDRATPVLVMAPHGGSIEPTTSQIAAAIAGETHSLYCFEGLKPGRPHADLHITSTRFDEPQARDLAAVADIVIAIHGRKDRDDPESVWLGGLNEPLRDAIGAELEKSGFPAIMDNHAFAGESSDNICNRGKHGGVQLEIPRTLRDTLANDATRMAQFADAVRRALELPT